MIEIYAEGIIGVDLTPEGLREALGTGSEPVLMYWNSLGGLVHAGAALYAVLSEYPGQITVRVQGIAASAATMAIMGADRIEMSVGSVMMIHDPSQDFAGYRGVADEHRRIATALDVITASMIEIYAKKSGRSEAQIERWMKEETYFTSEDAVAAGLADEVHDPGQSSGSDRGAMAAYLVNQPMAMQVA